MSSSSDHLNKDAIKCLFLQKTAYVVEILLKQEINVLYTKVAYQMEK